MKKKHFVWVINNTDQWDHSIEALLNDPTISSTLLYNFEDKKARSLFPLFDAAFPLVDFSLQIEQLDPDLVCLEDTIDPEKTPKLIQKFQPRFQSVETPSLGLVIRSSNDAEIIEQTLKGVQGQNVRIEQTIVVDCLSTDGTREIINRYGYPILDIDPKDYFPGKVLNLAIQQLNTELILFLNSDAVPLARNTIQKLIEPFIAKDTAATYARQLPRPEAKSWVRRDYLAAFPSGRAPEWMGLSLCHAAIRRSQFDLHPFYTDAWGSEDVEWGTWAKSTGQKIVYVPQSIVMHSHNYSLRQLYGRKFIEGEADAFIHRKKYSYFNLFSDTVKSIVRDCLHCLQKHKWQELPFIPSTRAVYYWGYFKGVQHGNRRIEQKDSDSSFGQKAVLKHRSK